MTLKEIDGFVSVVNSIIELACQKYPEELEFDELSIGYDDDGNIYCANGDDLEETLAWVNESLIPELLSK